MKRISKTLRNAVPLAALLLSTSLAGCGGGGGTTTTSGYSIGGTVSGLNGSVVLQNNGSDNLTVSASGTFTFATKVNNNGTYAVTVKTQPAGQTCSVSTGAGTVSGGNVTNVAVTCAANAYTVGGTVSGLTGSVVLQDNNGDNLTVSANGAYTFATPVAYGSPYAVTVLTQPTGKSCSVANGTGTIATTNVSNVAITCAANTHTVGGTVTGLNGTVVLQDNGADNLSVAVNGPFTFPTAVTYGNPYSVSILSKPTRQLCSVSAGAGTVLGNVSTVGVSCLSQLGGSVQGAALNLSNTVSTFAGVAGTLVDGTGAGARFNFPAYSVADSTGTNLYVSDASNNAIRKIVIATGAVTTLAGSPTGVAGAADGSGSAATFNSPQGITIDATDTNLYVVDMNNHKIRKIVIATGAVSSFTGTASTAGVATALDGAAATATFNTPVGITTDGTNLYVADQLNNKIRKIVIATGAVSSFTGTANTAGAATALDGPATAATFNLPADITTDGTNLYVADTSNNKIRKIVINTGAVSSITGAANTAGVAGAADGTGAPAGFGPAGTATFSGPIGITTDGTNLYVTDWSNNKIRQVAIANGAVTSFTGAANAPVALGFADGAAATAKFNGPTGITRSGTNLYVVDSSNHKIRKIVIGTGAVSSLAGKPAAGAAGTGAGVALFSPDGITSDGTSLFVADSGDQIIRKIDIATGATTTLAGQVGVVGAADNATGTMATFSLPIGITTDGTNLYVVDQGNNKIRKIVIATGAVSSFTGTANTAGVAGAVDGAAAGATFNNPAGITTDGTNLYVVDRNNNKIRKIVIATGAVSSFTGTANTPSVMSAVDGAAAGATFTNPAGITTDGTNLYVVDQGNQKIRKIVISSGVVSSMTGTAGALMALGAADGAAAGASFFNPAGITTDGTNLYVADNGNQKIRKIVISSGVVSSLTGAANTAGVAGAADGAASAATFSGPQDITTDGTSLYVADRGNGTIRKLQ